MPKNHINTDVSYLSLVHKNTPKEKYNGKCIYNDYLFQFSLTKQIRKSPYWRGTVSAIDNKGFVANAKVKTSNDTITTQKVSTAVTCHSDDLEEIKQAITSSVNRLFFEYSSAIEAKGSGAFRPESITPITAFNKYSETFISKEYPRASASSQEQYLTRLKGAIKKLPHKPMCQFTEDHFEKHLKSKNQQKITMLKKFWDFCIEEGYCNGSNPVPKKTREKTKKKTSLKGTIKVDHLLPEQETIVYDYIENKLTPPLAGVAMLLGSSLTDNEVISLKWSDIEIISPIFVVVKNYKPEYAGATKNYTRPLAPRAAHIIYLLYKQLSLNYSESQMESMYVITPVKRPFAQYSREALIKTATNVLLRDVLSYEQYKLISNKNLDFAAAKSILKNTFIYDLETRCNLKAAPGYLDFLLGKSLRKDVTSDSYHSFTSPAGLRHAHELMLILRKEEPLCYDDTEYLNDPNSLTVVSETTHSQLTLAFKVVLPPGGKFSIACEHGVHGTIKAINQEEPL